MIPTFHRAVVWRSLDRPAMDMCSLWLDDGGWRLEGHSIAAYDGQPVQIGYRVLCDEEWNTRLVKLDLLRGAGQFRAQFTTYGGTWFNMQSDLPDLHGAFDVLLDCTPATLILPIRRLGLVVGQSAELRMACIRFPLMQLIPLAVAITRTDDLKYQITLLESGSNAEIEVDTFGFLKCQDGVWAAEATT